MAFEWDPDKAEANFRKHGIMFSTEAQGVFDDDFALTVTDDESDPAEQRFVTIGVGTKGQLLVVVYSYRNENIRIISARPATPHERQQYEEQK